VGKFHDLPTTIPSLWQVAQTFVNPTFRKAREKWGTPCLSTRLQKLLNI